MKLKSKISNVQYLHNWIISETAFIISMNKGNGYYEGRR